MEYADASKYQVLTVAEAQSQHWVGNRVPMQPPRAALAGLKVNRAVKIAVAARNHEKPAVETLIVSITKRDGKKFEGQVVQRGLMRSLFHGVRPLDIVRFEMRHILDVLFVNPLFQKPVEETDPRKKPFHISFEDPKPSAPES